MTLSVRRGAGMSRTRGAWSAASGSPLASAFFALMERRAYACERSRWNRIWGSKTGGSIMKERGRRLADSATEALGKAASKAPAIAKKVAETAPSVARKVADRTPSAVRKATAKDPGAVKKAAEGVAEQTPRVARKVAERAAEVATRAGRTVAAAGEGWPAM